MTIHVIQYCHGGIPDEPELFLNRSDAAARFAEFYDEDELVYDGTSGEPIKREELVDCGYLCDAQQDDEARWWELETK